MFHRPRFFRDTEVKTDCEVCGAFFDLLKGGVCERCRRILCARHLHGSWQRRIVADITGHAVCPECRRAG